MSRRSLARRAGVPTVHSRWVMPVQVRNDVETAARLIGWNGGELVALFVIRGLKALRTRWNEEAMHVQIPELPSLRLEDKGWSIKDVMESLRAVETDSWRG